MPEFQSAKFGELVFDNHAFKQDLVVPTTGKAYPRGPRPENHTLGLEELKKYMDAKTKKVILGRGFSSVFSISPEAREFLASKRISLSESDSRSATVEYSREPDKSIVVAVIHSTC